jgi:hypothetical protein
VQALSRQRQQQFRIIWLLVGVSLLVIGPFANFGHLSARGGAPVIVRQSFYPSTPAVFGGPVGVVKAENSPTSWAIVAGDSAGDFSISEKGLISFTVNGATHYDGGVAERQVTLTVQASNSIGSGVGFIEINAYADGSVGAPDGPVQYPNGLSGYRARPPWKVAGFDYYVGIPRGTVLIAPTSISDPNVTVSGNVVVCNGNGAAVTLNAVDFTGYYIKVPKGGCSSVTVTNSKFACVGDKSPAFTFFHDQNDGIDVIRSSNINSGDACDRWPNNVSDPIACGRSCTIEYNWFYHASERIVNMAVSTLYRWNLIDSPQTEKGAHENYQQFGGGITADSDRVEFNASYNVLPGGGEGYQFYGNVLPAKIVSPVFQYNTMIAAKSGGGPTMSYMVHGSCHTAGQGCTKISGTGMIAHNYFDPSGAYGIFYQGTLTPLRGWSSRGNIDMVTGSTVVPQ